MNRQRHDNFEPAELFETSYLRDSGNNGSHFVSFTPSNRSNQPMVFYKANAIEPKASEMNEKSITKAQFWIGVIISSLTVVVAACATTWAISNNINDKVNQSRLEISASLQTNKSELSSRIDRVEDKVDTGFKDTNNGINDLKILINGKNHANTDK